MPDSAAEAAHLLDQAAGLGALLTRCQAERLLAFRDLVLEWNRAFNLVSRRDTGRLVPRHVLDSLTVLGCLTGEDVLDVGTGAGFPGIPLAIAREDASFTLIDLSERKIRFVQQIIRRLGLRNVDARCIDVRALEPERTFDTVVCRAVAGAAAVWQLAGSRVRPHGRLVVMASTRPHERGSNPDDPAADALPRGARLERVLRVQIPGLDAPHELVLMMHASGGP